MTADHTAGLSALREALEQAPRVPCPHCEPYGAKGIIYLNEPCNCKEVEPAARHVCVHYVECGCGKGTVPDPRYAPLWQLVAVRCPNKSCEQGKERQCSRCETGRPHPQLSPFPEHTLHDLDGSIRPCSQCHGTGWALNPVWRDAPPGALMGAISVAVKRVDDGFWFEWADRYGQLTATHDPDWDAAALEAATEAVRAAGKGGA